MSSRQMRRLQHLVDASTGADADFGETVEEASSTMKPANAERRKKGQKKSSSSSKPAPSKQHDTPESAAALSSEAKDGRMECELPVPVVKRTRATAESSSALTQPPATTSTTSVGSDTHSASAPTKPSTTVSSSAASPPSVSAHATKSATTASGKKKAKGKKQAAHDDEEDALLEAVLQQRELEAAALPTDPMDADTSDPSQDILRLLVECDVARLDTRVERVRSFGANAVEDYGDGLTTSRMPDGAPRDNGSNSLFPEHHGRFHFKKSVFASPNRYRWPPFDSEDTFVQVVTDAPAATTSPSPSHDVSGSPAKGPIVFRLNVDTPAFKRAQSALVQAVQGHGNVQALVDCLAHHGVYHVPTLLQLRETFQLMNDPLRAHEMIDIALYYAGIMLSRFPLARTWRTRQLPLAVGNTVGNRCIHRTLWLGIHAALSRGCMRTAFEINRCLLSLDPDDAFGALLTLDYTALRAKRWVWLLQVVSLYRAALPSGASPESLLADGFSEGLASGTERLNATCWPQGQSWTTPEMATWLCLSPGLAFSAALARHMLDREEALYVSESQQNAAAKRPKVLKEMTAAQTQVVHSSPSAEQLMVWAMQQYPLAATALVAELGGIETVCKGQSAPNALWDSLVVAASLYEEAAGANPHACDLHEALAHVAELFVARATDMWKAPDVMNFLRLVLTRPEVCDTSVPGCLYDPHRADSLRALLRDYAPVRMNGLHRYADRTAAEIRDDAPTALPADLLNGADDGGDAMDVGDLEAFQRMMANAQGPPAAAELALTEHDALLRFRALYGVSADPDDQGTEAELSAFRHRFHDEEHGVAEFLGGMNPAVLAFRALAPRTTMESIALEAALAARGIADPVRAEAAAHRARDEEMWDADNEDAWASAEEGGHDSEDWGEPEE